MNCLAEVARDDLRSLFFVELGRTVAGIYDITGERIETTGKYRQWAGAELPLGKRLFEIDFHTSKMHQIEREYGSRVDIDGYHDDDLVTLASLDPNLTVEDLMREFELTPHSAYIQRAQEAQDTQRPAGPGKVGDMCANASRNDSIAWRETSPEERIEARCVAEINQMQASGSGPACAARFSLGGFLPLARASR